MTRNFFATAAVAFAAVATFSNADAQQLQQLKKLPQTGSLPAQQSILQQATPPAQQQGVQRGTQPGVQQQIPQELRQQAAPLPLQQPGVRQQGSPLVNEFGLATERYLPIPPPTMGVRGIEGYGIVEVTSVVYGSAADRLGLEPGDYILEINGHKIESLNCISEALRSAALNDRGQIRVLIDNVRSRYSRWGSSRRNVLARTYLAGFPDLSGGCLNGTCPNQGIGTIR